MFAKTVLPVAIGVVALVMAAATPPEVLKLEGDTEQVHDPVIIKCKDTYYVFCTGGPRRRHSDPHFEGPSALDQRRHGVRQTAGLGD